MKALYLAGSIVFSVLILILAFGNIDSQWSGMNFFFYTVDFSPTIIILLIAVIGIITGALYHAFLSQALNTSEEEEDQEF